MIVLDTTVLIDHLRGHEPARSFLAALTEVPACSEITRVEILRGIRSGEHRATETLLGTMTWIEVDESIARRAGDLGPHHRRSHPGLAIADLIIAASTGRLGATLATSNVRRCPMFPGLEAPY